MESKTMDSIMKKVKSKVKKFWDSRDISYTTERIRIKDGFYLILETERISIEEIEEGYFGYEPGTPMQLTIYAEKNGKEIDACTVLYPEMQNYEADAKYLILCYW